MGHDLNRVLKQLAKALPGQAISELRPLTTGFSNETYLVEGAIEDPGLILRLPPAAGAMLDGWGVLDQARIYQALGEVPGAPPVPGVVVVSDDPDQPFFVMERVPGEAIDDINMQPWFTEASDAERNRLCRAWIGAFASNAKLAPVAALGPAMTPEQDLHRWRTFAGSAQSDATVSAIGRLLKRPAPRSGPPGVVHGDPKLSNLMWHQGRISAMLDWEMALNGEPLSDLAYMLYTFENRYHPATRAQQLPGMLTRDETIALWEIESGRSAAGFEWHEIAQFCKLCAILAEGVNMRNTGRSDDPKLAYFAANLDSWIALTEAMLDDAGL